MTKRIIKYVNSLIFIFLIAFMITHTNSMSSFADQQSYDCASWTAFKSLDIFCENPDEPGKYFNGSTTITYEGNTYNYYKIKKGVTVNVLNQLQILDNSFIEGELDGDEKSVTLLRKVQGQMIYITKNVVLKDLIIDGDSLIGSSEGIVSDSSLVMENVLFKNFINNKTSGTIYGNIKANSNLKVNNCWFDNNKAYKKNGDDTENLQGGVIFTKNGNASITNSKFTRTVLETSNEAGNATCGGVIFTYSGTLNISNCVFGDKDDASLGNKTNYLVNAEKSPTGGIIGTEVPTTISDCKFYNNSCTSIKQFYGGCICARKDITISGCDFDNNSCSADEDIYGGCIYVEKQITISGCEFDNNYLESSNWIIGGIIYLVSEQLDQKISGCSFKENVINNGFVVMGGIVGIYMNTPNATRNGKTEITNSIIENNIVYGPGYIYGGSIGFYSVDKANEKSTKHLYTLIIGDNDNNVIIRNNKYSISNIANSLDGGCIWATNIKNVLMNNVIVENNEFDSYSGSGASIFCEGSGILQRNINDPNTLTINNSAIINNTAKAASSCQGNIFIVGYTSINDTNISNNKIIPDVNTIELLDLFEHLYLTGGGIYNGYILDLNNVNMIGNEAEYGGSIYNEGILNISGKINIPLKVDGDKISNEITFYFSPNDDYSKINMYSYDGTKSYEYDDSFDKIGIAEFSYLPGNDLLYSNDDIDFNNVFRFVKYDLDEDDFLTKELVSSNDVYLTNVLSNTSDYVSKFNVNLNSLNDDVLLSLVNYDSVNKPDEIKLTFKNENVLKGLIYDFLPNFKGFVDQGYGTTLEDLYDYIYNMYDVNYTVNDVDIVLDNTNSNIIYSDNDKVGRAIANIIGIPDTLKSSYIFGNADLKYDIVCDISSATDVRLVLDGDNKRLYAGGKIVDSDVDFSNLNVDPSGVITIDANCGADYDIANGDYYKGSKTGIKAKEISFVEQDEIESAHIELTDDTRLYNTVKCDIKDIVDNAEKSEIKLNIKEKNVSDLDSLTGATKTQLNELKDSKKELGVFNIYVSRTDTNRLSGSVVDEKQNLFSDKTLTLELSVNKPVGNYKNYKLLHVLDNGNVEDTNAIVTTDDDKIKLVFNVSEFSDFILVADEETSNGGGSSHKKNKTTDDNNNNKVEEEHKSIITGYDDGTFNPNGFVTREVMATLIARLSKDYDEKIDYTKYILDDNISDVPLDFWSANYIGYVVKNNIMNMVDNNSFYPQRNLTRGELCKVICSFKNFELTKNNSKFDDTKDMWYEKYVATLENINYINGYPDGNFKGDNSITRAELSKVICLMEERDIKDVSKITYSLKNELKNKYYDIDINEWYIPYVFEISYDHKVSLVH